MEKIIIDNDFKEEVINIIKKANQVIMNVYSRTNFDIKLKLTKELKLRGIPITLIVNSQGKEVGRIIGDLDFTDPRFIAWINIQ